MIKKLLTISLATCMGLSCVVGNFSNVKAYEKDVVPSDELVESEVSVYLDDENYLVATLDSDGVECYVNPIGATDEYYYLESYSRTSGEFVLKTERYSKYYQAGVALVKLANASSLFWKPVNDAVIDAAFVTVTTFVPSVSKNYNTVVTHYATYAKATYRIEVGGQVSRYATYTNLKVPTKKAYDYNG